MAGCRRAAGIGLEEFVHLSVANELTDTFNGRGDKIDD